MIASKYNIYSKSSDIITIYNTLSMKKARLSVDRWQSFLDNEFAIGDNLKSFFSTNDETLKAQYLLNCIKYQSTRLSITLMVTMDCNCSCSYCFEQEYQNRSMLSITGAERFVEWIIKTVKYYKITEVDLCFHGGEPLLNVDSIGYIAKTLREYFRMNHIGYMFSIVSNGTLFYNSISNYLFEIGVSIAQITLDGCKEIHDSRRPYKNGNGTFDDIINNLFENVDIDIFLNVVYDANNYECIPTLIDYLNSHRLSKKIVKINLSSTLPIISDNQLISSSLNLEKDAEVKVLLLRKIMDKGFCTNFQLTHKICSLRCKASFVISPELQIYSCISGICNNRFLLGSIDDIVDPFEIKYRDLMAPFDARCIDCTYFPICIKDCIYEHKIIGHKNCKKSFWDIFCPKYIEMLNDIKYNDLTIKPENDKKRISI